MRAEDEAMTALNACSSPAAAELLLCGVLTVAPVRVADTRFGDLLCARKPLRFMRYVVALNS